MGFPSFPKRGKKSVASQLLDKRPALSEVSPSVEAARFRVTPRSALGECRLRVLRRGLRWWRDWGYHGPVMVDGRAEAAEEAGAESRSEARTEQDGSDS